MCYENRKRKLLNLRIKPLATVKWVAFLALCFTYTATRSSIENGEQSAKMSTFYRYQYRDIGTDIPIFISVHLYMYVLLILLLLCGLFQQCVV